MPITIANMATTPYRLVGPNPAGANAGLAGLNAMLYRVFNFVPMQHALNAPPPRSPTQATFALNVAGNCTFFTYIPDGVTCMVIPQIAAGVPAIQLVATSNLHGCAVFIERRTTGHIVIYHANAVNSLYATPGGAVRNVNPPVAVANQHPAFQTGDAIVKLMHLYNTARTSATIPGATQDVHALFKAEYFQPVQAEIARKRHQGRRVTQLPLEVGTVVGFYNPAGPSWDFYRQTWASLSYRRPMFSAKSFIFNRNKLLAATNVKLLGGAQLIVSYN